ncbi:MAG TPA: Asp-tRNA(Asn)/Glu-tRNA(Gln) amidotransferase subunit GatC [Candidatus Acidoferrales bacterium]|nr:Asp-tRNA(Asn)/Glu-tRNA(Gln) amidotransferase subunit GatC [Candidatus Acidoferrales bacterium]
MASGDIDVAYVAKLARLELTSYEIEKFDTQLSSLLEHVAMLERLPLEDVAATAQVIPSRNVARDDVARPSLPHERVMAGAPKVNGIPCVERGYFRVPRIISEE